MKQQRQKRENATRGMVTVTVTGTILQSPLWVGDSGVRVRWVGRACERRRCTLYAAVSTFEEEEEEEGGERNIGAVRRKRRKPKPQARRGGEVERKVESKPELLI